MKALYILLIICLMPTFTESQNCFNIGSTKDEVRSIQGLPTSVNNYFGNETWGYDYSSITFENGKVKEYSNISKNLKICNSSSYGYKSSCFSIGSAKSEVRSIQGTPTSINNYFGNETWGYDYSSVIFENGMLKEYSNISKNLKICNLGSNITNSRCFNIGSTVDEVRAIQGNPTSVNNYFGNETWGYDYSSVTFENGKLKEYSNISKNLKICADENSSNFAEPKKSRQESKPIFFKDDDIGFSPFVGQLTSNVNFLTAPSQTSSKITMLKANSQIYSFSNKTTNGYYKIIDIETNKIGWVRNEYVKYIKSVDINESGAFKSTGYNSNYNSEVKIKNTSSYSIKLIVGKEIFSLSPNSTKTVNIEPGRKYYIASAPGVIPASGLQEFDSNNGYEWEFWVKYIR